MRAVSACFGDDPDATLEILIGQLVSLVRAGRVVRLSKRAGDVITLTDIVSAIGTDAARYAMVRYAVDSPIDIDMDLWSRRSADSPARRHNRALVAGRCGAGRARERAWPARSRRA
jgi:arginyl-tRNA synthetase